MGTNTFIVEFLGIKRHIITRSPIICVASLQNGPLVGRNESGIIPDLSKNYIFLNFHHCLLISIHINIVFYIYINMAVICNNTFLNVILNYFFFNNVAIFSIMNLLKLASE